MHPTSSPFARKIGSGLLASAVVFSVALTTQAKDLSIPYRNNPGFTCYSTNAAGECVDFGYFDAPSYRQNAPVLRAPLAPVYRAPVYSTSSRYTNNYYDPTYRPTSSYPTQYYPSNNCGNGYSNCNGNGYYNDPCNSDCYGYRQDVSIAASGTPNPVSRGDLLTYRIYLRNDGPTDRTISVRALLDRGTVFSSANDGYVNRGTEVDWNSVRLMRGSSTTLVLAVRVTSAARDGDRLTLRVDTDGDSDTVQTDVRDSYRTTNYYDNGYYNDPCYSTSSRCTGSYNNCGSTRYNDCYNNDGDITVQADTNSSSVYPGDLVTFTVRLRNDQSSGRTVDVNGSLDSDLDFYSSSDGGYRSGSSVRWDNVYVSANSSRTLTFSARVSNRVRSGDSLDFRVNADGETDDVTVRVR